MATTAISGKGGTLTSTDSSGTLDATEITSWEVAITTEALEATSMASDGWKEFIEGLSGATGSFECVGIKPVQGTKSVVTFSIDDSGTLEIEGTIIVSEVNTSTPHDGVVTYRANFSFTGEVTVT